jgi:hypothetical protein
MTLTAAHEGAELAGSGLRAVGVALLAVDGVAVAVAVAVALLTRDGVPVATYR